MLFLPVIFTSVQNCGLHYLKSIFLPLLLPVSGFLWNAITTYFLSKLLCHICLLYLAANSVRKWKCVCCSVLMCRHASQHENLHKGIVAVRQAHKLYVREEAGAFCLDTTERDLANSPNVENSSRNLVTAVEANNLEGNTPLLTEVQRNCTSLNLSNTFSVLSKSRYLMLKRWVFLLLELRNCMDLENESSLLIPEQYTKEKFHSVYLYVPRNVTMVLQWRSCLACGKSIPISAVAVSFSSQKLRRGYHHKRMNKNVKQMLEV